MKNSDTHTSTSSLHVKLAAARAAAGLRKQAHAQAQEQAQEQEQEQAHAQEQVPDEAQVTADMLKKIKRDVFINDFESVIRNAQFTIAALIKSGHNINSDVVKRESEFLVALQKELKKLKKEFGLTTDETDDNDVRERALVKSRHPFFTADLLDYALRDDAASMEAPIFTLSTKPDLSIREWRSKDGNKYIKVYPSVLGRATQHDKDILIYVVSQLVEGLNRGREDAQNRVVRFTVHDFMLATNRSTDGHAYKRLHESFERLAGTRITTDIRTGGERIREGFGIIDAWRIIEKSPTDERMIAVEVTLSRWLYNAVQALEVLTIHPDYFRLRKPLARRLYEIARKHCGKKRTWEIGLDLLHEKTGSTASTKKFHEMLKDVEYIPEFSLTVQGYKVIFTKNS